MQPDTSPHPAPSPSAAPGRALRWADRLLLAGLALALLTVCFEGVGLFTFFFIPICLYLSWVGYVAAWPVPRGYRWVLVGVSALAAHFLVLGMASGGYLGSALVCGAEVLAAAAWQRRRRATGHWFGPAALALWLAAAYWGLKGGSLHAAVRDDNAWWTELLLRNGADPNATVEGQPVLYEALSGRTKPAVIGLLLRHGANPNARWNRADGSLIMPVAFAFPSGGDPGSDQEIFRLLLAARLNPCQVDQHGENFRRHLRDTFSLTAADSVALARAERRCGCH